MKKMTEQNIRDAFAGESQAHMKYLAFAEKAEKEGKPNIARLFKAVAYAEKVHAINHLNVLEAIKDTKENLQSGIDGEDFEIDEMYPAYNVVADLQNEKDAKKSIYYAIEAEKIHSILYKEAKETVASGEDLSDTPVLICPICGHTAMGEAPNKCPICSAAKDKYIKF